MCRYNKHCTTGCNKCQPLNQSNKTVVVPVQGAKGDPLTWDDLTEEQKLSLKGDKGDKGEDGATPMFRGNSTTKTWEVSYDNGVTWINTGTPYSGADGDTFIPEFSDDYFDII